MNDAPAPTEGPLQRLLGGLQSRQLVYVVGLLFLLDLFVPDPIPFIDELLLGALTLLLAGLRDRKPAAAPRGKPPMKNVTPPRAS